MAVALVVAAGSGERLGSDRPKAFVVLGGKPMVQWSVEALQAVPRIERIVVALPHGWQAPAGTVGVAGGASRSESVRAALAAVPGGDPVIVHDAARPLATAELFRRALDELGACGCDGVVAAAAVADTIKRADAQGRVLETPERAHLWAAQTPQVFRRSALDEALSNEAVLGKATDDAALVEATGGDVRVLPAPAENIKVTTRLDLRLAESLLGQHRRIELVRRIGDAVARREEASWVFSHYHDDVVWDVTHMGQAQLGQPVYQGHEGVRQFWREWLEAWGRVSFDFEDFVAEGEHVVVLLRAEVRGRGSGIGLETGPYAQVYTFRDDKVAAIRMFSRREDAFRFAREGA